MTTKKGPCVVHGPFFGDEPITAHSLNQKST